MSRSNVVRATFLHANLHGNEIVDAILDFPAPCTSRGASFGQASFMVLGLIARLGGGRFEVIAAGNQLLGAGCAGLPSACIERDPAGAERFLRPLARCSVTSG